MILLSAGGSGTQRHLRDERVLAVGTVDGIWFLRGREEGDWVEMRRALQGCHVSALAQCADGGLIAGMHGHGLARSDDGGVTWRFVNRGLTQFDVWALKAERLNGREALLVGTMPAHLFVSADGGLNWTERPALRRLPTAPEWFFPPPPHLAHVKDVVVLGARRLVVGVEVGALAYSDDGGESFAEFPVAANISEIDIHRILVHEERPQWLLLATGWGVAESLDGGRSWQANSAGGVNYPDAAAVHPQNPQLIFLAGGQGYPPNWFKINRSRSIIVRSRDGGRTWERLLGGLPAGARPAFGAISIAQYAAGSYSVFAADTDGQIFESRDGGEHWEVIFEAAAVSKGNMHRALQKHRPWSFEHDALMIDPIGTQKIEQAVP